jgi:CRP/FNR family transcriptional regulator
MATSTKEQVTKFFQTYPQLSRPDGTILIQAEQQPSGVHFLISGSVKMLAISNSGDELVLNIFRPSAFFPMSWAINHTANPYFYQAIGPVCYHLAPREDVMAFIQQQPAVMLDLLSRIYRGADGLLQRMTYLQAGNKYATVITELLITAKRFGTSGSTPSSLEVDLNQQDIASQSGMARETVSREMRRLKDKGLITFTHHRLVIPNVERLEAELANQ